jgi:hypothetical protein
MLRIVNATNKDSFGAAEHYLLHVPSRRSAPERRAESAIQHAAGDPNEVERSQAEACRQRMRSSKYLRVWENCSVLLRYQYRRDRDGQASTGTSQGAGRSLQQALRREP